MLVSELAILYKYKKGNPPSVAGRSNSLQSLLRAMLEFGWLLAVLTWFSNS